MTIMELVKETDPILTTPTEAFDFDNPPLDPEKLAMDLVEFMRGKGGVGIAANQVGLPYSVFAMDGEPAHVCFNPRIINMSEETIVLEEGCLSWPGLILPIERSRHVRIRFTGPNGETFTKQFINMTARIIQHECSHLRGEVFFEGLVSRTKLSMAIKKAKKYGYDYSDKGLMKYAST